MSNYRDQLESYLKTLDIKTDRVLDVGGASNPIKGRTKSWEVKDCAIVDNKTENVDEPDIFFDIGEPLKENGFIIQSEEGGAFFGNPEANIIFCLEVMEYIYDPVRASKNLNNLLKEDGILYITFPFIYSIHQPVEADYMRYTKQGAIKLLSKAGFKILDIIPRTMTPEGQALMRQFRIAEGMHAAKKIVHNELGWIIKCQKL